MKTLPRDQANELWQEWWGEMRDEWFKVEVLQDYSGEDAGPSLDSWLKADKKTSIELLKREVSSSVWVKMCRMKVDQGVNLIRVHVVEESYTPYIEWEIQHYKHINMPECREKVYLINSLKVDDLDLPAGDMMIFDKKRVAVNTYNSHGRMTHQTFYDEHDNITRFLELRKKFIERAKSL